MTIISMAESFICDKVCQNRCDSLLASLRYMRDMNCMTDITLICHGHNFAAHRLVLAASSTYFRDTLRMKQKVTKINIRDIEVEVFRTVLNYFYTGQLDGPGVEGSKLESVLSALKNLKVLGLQKIANENVVKALSVTTYYRMWNLVRDLCLKDLEAEVAKFVASNLKSCSEMWYFHLLSLQQVMSILSSSSLNGQAPVDVYRAVTTWSAHLPDRRKKYVPSLLSVAGLTGDADKCSRLISNSDCSPDKHLASSRIPQHTRSNYSGMNKASFSTAGPSSSRCKTSRNESCRSDADVPVRGPSKEPYPARHRASLENLSTARGSQERMSNNAARTLDDSSLALLKKKLEKAEDEAAGEERTGLRSSGLRPTELPDAAAERVEDTQVSNIDSAEALEAYIDSPLIRVKNTASHSRASDAAMRMAVDGSKTAGRLAILCLGDARSGLRVQQCFDVMEGTWLPPRPTIRIPADHVTSFFWARSLYFVGGEAENNQRLQTAYEYRMDSLCLRQIASLTVARSRASMAHAFGHFYVIGGMGQYRKVLFSVEKYDPKADNWKPAAKLHTARSLPAVATVGNVMFAVGGFVDDSYQVTNTCECYCVESDQWTEIACLPSAFDDMTALVAEVRGTIFGVRLLQPDTVYQYDMILDVWREVGTCSVAVSRVTALLAFHDSLWLLDCNGGKFFRYELSSGEWTCSTQLPDTLIWPVQAFAIVPST